MRSQPPATWSATALALPLESNPQQCNCFESAACGGSGPFAYFLKPWRQGLVKRKEAFRNWSWAAIWMGREACVY